MFVAVVCFCFGELPDTAPVDDSVAPATAPVAVSAAQETAPEASTPVVNTSVQFTSLHR